MNPIINPLAETYINEYSTPLGNNLLEVYNKTLLKHPHQHLQSSWVQGQFLTFISQIAQPKAILEIGTFTGFSALCLAMGLHYTGELHTIELREEDAHLAKANFSISPKKNQIHLHIGNAIDIIPTLNKMWDIVFIDADKTSYINYYEMVLPFLNKTGFIIADNVLFHGQVLENEIKGKSAVAIHSFNEYVAQDDRTEQTILSIRDGLMIIKKKISE